MGFRLFVLYGKICASVHRLCESDNDQLDGHNDLVYTVITVHNCLMNLTKTRVQYSTANSLNKAHFFNH